MKWSEIVRNNYKIYVTGFSFMLNIIIVTSMRSGLVKIKDHNQFKEQKAFNENR